MCIVVIVSSVGIELLNMLYEELEIRGYEKHGNWYINGPCSINLHTKEIKSTYKKVTFSFTFPNDVNISQIEEIKTFLCAISTF